MSRYVQTFSRRDQAILNHTAFRPSAPQFTEVEAETPIDALWLNSGCTRWLFPDPNQDLPRIRRGDVIAFREIWIRRGPQNVILDGSLRGHFTPAKWVQCRVGYAALILAYRTFQLWVHSETSGRAVEFSILDVDQVLTNCSERFQGDEMPTCAGEWTRGDQRVQWQVQATPRPELGRMIRSTRDGIHKATQKEHVMQCDILIALRGFYRDPLIDDDRLPMAERQQPWQQIEEGQVYNEWLDGFVAQLGLSVRMVRGLPRRGVPDDKFVQHSVEQLVAMYHASRARMAGLNCECCQTPELSALLEE